LALEAHKLDAGGARVGALVRQAAAALVGAGVETPQSDARRLAQAALGRTAAQLIAGPEAPVAPEAAQRFADMIRRRCAREPVSRILGEREFYGRAFAVTPATLDPRPDSETVIEAALAIVDESGWREQPIRILDVGTGSGCLLVTLLSELPQASGLGGDINAEALKVAADNARRHGVINRMHVAIHDGLAGIAGPFHLIVCNPPYIASGDISRLSPEVRDYDPRLALDGGADGLDLYRALIPGLSRVVAHGWALFEVGAGQADAVAQLMKDSLPPACLREIRFWRDLGGHKRCVALQIQL
jgi:release factor glutamine methyltransferase